MFVLLTSV